MSLAALFEDPHTDARMRRTIPVFACLGAAAVLVTAPLAATSTNSRLQILGLAGLAVLVAAVVSWRGLVYRLPRSVIFGLLFSYVILIALGVTATGDAQSAYGLLYVIPIIFSAVFFVGWVRYILAVAAPIVDYVVVGYFLEAGEATHVVRLVVFVLLAHFGAVVSETLREALRANRSLHTVLEAASGAPLDSDLAGIGVEAALTVAGWDAGAVGLLRDGRIDIPALQGLSPEVVRYYLERPDELIENSIVSAAVETRAVSQFPDLASTAGADHPLVRDGVVSVAVVPISFGSELIGVLIVGHRSTRRLDNREEDRLTRVAEQLGLALGSAAAYRREREVADELRELNRHKDEFLANVSHELRTPAATIRLVATTLRRSSDRLDEAQREEMFDTLERRATQLTELIGNLLDEALADAGATRLVLTEIDWNEAVTRWSDVATLDSGRPVTLDLPATSPRGLGDAVKLERVVVNLLSNAAKFSEPDSPIELALSSDGREVVLSVTDHGIGIAAEEHGRIFDRFHQVDGGATRSVGGFGIGLSLAQHFVAAHGGAIEVDSVPGGGSTFTVRLPLASDQPTAPGTMGEAPARTVAR